MKKNILFSCICSLFIACEKEDDGIPESENNFEVTTNFSISEPTIDEDFTLDIESNKALQEVTWFAEEPEGLTHYPESENFQLPLALVTKGNRNLSFQFVCEDGDTINRSLNIEVVRGNAVQIEGIELIEFDRMGETWDPQYNEDDPARLADLIFALQKPMGKDIPELMASKNIWHFSEIHKNEESLFWDLSENNIYINPEYQNSFQFHLADWDEGELEEDNLLQHANVKVYYTHESYGEQPEVINIKREDINLEMNIHLNWP